jgi:outer membrane protein W
MMQKTSLLLFILIGAMVPTTQAQWIAKVGVGTGKPFQALKIGNGTFANTQTSYQTKFGRDQWVTLEAGRFVKEHIALNLGLTYFSGAKGHFVSTSNYINQDVSQYSRGFLICPTFNYYLFNKTAVFRPYFTIGPVISISPKLYRDDNYDVIPTQERIETAMYFNMSSTMGYTARIGANYKITKQFSLNIEMSMQRISYNQLIDINVVKKSKGEYTKYTINGVEAPESSHECTSCEFGSLVQNETINDGLMQYNPLSNIGLLLGLQWNF